MTDDPSEKINDLLSRIEKELGGKFDFEPPLHYVLVNKKVVPCKSLLAWGEFMEGADRVVKKSHVDGVEISTVFLGVDHAFMGGPPLFFETMIFGGEFNEEQYRCSTWEQAEKQHKVAHYKVLAMSDQDTFEA